MKELYIGLMTGTSLDAVDCALISVGGESINVVAYSEYELPLDLKSKLCKLCSSPNIDLYQALQAEQALTNIYVSSVASLLESTERFKTEDVRAIGCHGQTVLHVPGIFSHQLCDGALLAAKTGIDSVTDFRRKDIALGGQGAPLAPAFHQAAFAKKNQNRLIINIGGIGNISFLKGEACIAGFDTGPGNILIDAWIRRHLKMPYDENGQWSASGNVSNELHSLLLSDEYFKLDPPKSTGRETFNLLWLEKMLSKMKADVAAVDVAATLTELTAITIANDVKNLCSNGEAYVCGGGAMNKYLLERLRIHLNDAAKFQLATTSDIGIKPNQVEAVAFAWLAHQRVHQLPGNLPAVTGASEACVLGSLHSAR